MPYLTNSTREKNNLRVHGLVEDEKENLEETFIKFVQDNLQKDISADEIAYSQDWIKEKERRRVGVTT